MRAVGIEGGEPVKRAAYADGAAPAKWAVGHWLARAADLQPGRFVGRPWGAWLVGAWLLAGAAPAGAGESAAFLALDSGARWAGMGSAGSALPGASSPNPGGPAGLLRREGSLTHAEMFAGLRHESLSYGHPASWGVWGLSAVLLTQPSLEGRDAAGRPAGGFEAFDRAFGASAARRMGGWRVGAGLKYVESGIAGVVGRSVAADLGAQRGLGGLPVDAGVYARHLGPGMRFVESRSPLPLTLGAGVAWRAAGALTLAADVRHRPHAPATELAAGIEYALPLGASVRLGYAALAGGRSPAGASLGFGSGGGAIAGFGAGAGLQIRSLSLDYAVSPSAGPGPVQRISLSVGY